MFFPDLVSIAGKLLDYAEALPWVRRRPVFLVGDSLGAFIAVALSFRRQDITALSEISGGLPRGYNVERLRPLRILILHGAKDQIVSPVEAKLLADYCTTHGITVETHIYPDEGHYFSPSLESKVLPQTIAFFRSSR